MQVLESMTGGTVNWENSLEVELSARKRVWLEHFSRPLILASDVTGLGGDTTFNYMCDSESALPTDLSIYSFGFSCKDLSNLNNVTSSWKDDCLESGQGTTGATWQGNLTVAEKTRPWLLLMENVPSSRRGNNYATMCRDLSSLGYALYDRQLNSADFGLPQSRERAWFLGIRKDLLAHSFDQSDFNELVDTMKITSHLPLSRFLLSPDHPYLLEVQAERRAVVEKRAIAKEKAQSKSKKQAKRKAKAKAQQSPAAEAATSAAKEKARRGSGLKWICDHWKARRMMNIPPSGALPPAHVSDAACHNSMTPREADLWHMCNQGPELPNGQPTVELKHNALRVVSLNEHKSKSKRREGSTSCLLPTSKLLVRPPSVPRARFLLGLEALSIQGIDQHWLATDRVASDAEYLNLAGNAFSGGCFAAVLLVGLSHINAAAL